MHKFDPTIQIRLQVNKLEEPLNFEIYTLHRGVEVITENAISDDLTD